LDSKTPNKLLKLTAARQIVFVQSSALGAAAA